SAASRPAQHSVAPAAPARRTAPRTRRPGVKGLARQAVAAEGDSSTAEAPDRAARWARRDASLQPFVPSGAPPRTGAGRWRRSVQTSPPWLWASPRAEAEP